MKKNLKKAVAAVLAGLICVTVSGCLSVSADELYQLPKSSERYVQIQQKINEIQSGGVEYAAPISGYNRQAIQLRDVDGDGTEEAVAFFRTDDEKPLRIYFLKEMESSFEVVATIDGDGTAVDSVSYVDMDGDGVSEIIVGWQMSPSVKMMGIYSIKDYQPVQLAAGSYTSYTWADMDGNGDDEVILLQAGTSETLGSATMYLLMKDGEMMSYSAYLSSSAEMIARTQTGLLSDRKNGVFVDSVCGSGLITDVIVFKSDALVNITMNEDTQNSVTERPYAIYTTDINGDGMPEIPEPVALYPQSETVYYAVNWNNCTSRGYISSELTTYHNYSDGWYLIIPAEWMDKMTIRREDGVAGERTVVFSMVTYDETGEASGLEDFLKVYSLTGDNKEDKASVEGRFLIREKGEKIYAACILEGGGEMVTAEYIKENFRVIHSDWLYGSI